ncbi:MAG: hypothetical protein Q7R56_02220 [Nanoarchaeota archaeon]|nr:hypothetical protein [Nanoarchaeota archaeon]
MVWDVIANDPRLIDKYYLRSTFLSFSRLLDGFPNVKVGKVEAKNSGYVCLSTAHRDAEIRAVLLVDGKDVGGVYACSRREHDHKLLLVTDESLELRVKVPGVVKFSNGHDVVLPSQRTKVGVECDYDNDQVFETTYWRFDANMLPWPLCYLPVTDSAITTNVFMSNKGLEQFKDKLVLEHDRRVMKQVDKQLFRGLEVQ